MINPFISVVSPVYYAENIVEELVLQLRSVLSKITLNYEIILVEDGSTDNSWKKIEEIHNKYNKNVRGIKLSRNFGQHYAITAGIEAAKGDYVIVIDCDLQENPIYILDLYNKICEKNEIVFTIKNNRKHNLFKNITASLFTKLFNYLTDSNSLKSNQNIGTYSIISRKAANAFLQYNDYHRHYLMVLRWIGFKHDYILIDHNERFAGKSSYTLSKLLKHAIDGIISQSDKLLRIFINIGLFISFSSFTLIFIIILLYTYHGFLSGWASLASIILFSTGMILTGIGIIGIYLAKTFEQTKNRPKYIIDKKLES